MTSMTSEGLVMLLLLSSLAPVKAGNDSKTALIAWCSFAVVMAIFISAGLYVRHRRTQQSYRPQDGGSSVPQPVSAWSKAAPPKDNGRAAYGGGGVPGGAWERDA